MSKKEKVLAGLMIFGLLINGVTLGASVQRVLEQIDNEKTERTIR